MIGWPGKAKVMLLFSCRIFRRYMVLCSCHTSSPKHVQALQIQEVHLGTHFNTCNVYRFYQCFLPVLSRTSFTFRTSYKDQEIEQLFYCPVVQAPLPGDLHKLSGKWFSACYLQAFKKVPHAKSGTFWFPWMDSHDSSTIQ